jgi:hypothetical protein
MVIGMKCPRCGLMQLPGPQCKSCGMPLGASRPAIPSNPPGAERPLSPTPIRPKAGIPSVRTAAPTGRTRWRASEWKSLFTRIEDAAGARKQISSVAGACYVVGGITAIAAFFIGLDALIDGLLFAGLGLWLHRRESRVAAVPLLLLSSAGLVVTALNHFGGGTGGRNLFLAALMLWAGIRAVEATFKLPRFLGISN